MKYAIIVAGGSGTRMKTSLPKQFLELSGRPVLMHTLERFFHFDESITLILVLPADQFQLWNALCSRHAFSIPHEIVAGGETRYLSVQNGLKKVSIPGLVAIHDGVRPLVSRETLRRCFTMAAESGNAIPVIPVFETVRQVQGDNSTTLERNKLYLVQTPQVFYGEMLKEAYNHHYPESFTDDASVVEKLGIKINLTEGNRENIKITEPVDLLIAELFLKIII